MKKLQTDNIYRYKSTNWEYKYINQKKVRFYLYF